MGAYGARHRDRLRGVDALVRHAATTRDKLSLAVLSTVFVSAPDRSANAPAARWKQELDAGRRTLEAAYREHGLPRRLLVAQSRLTDRVLRGLWAEIAPPAGCALVAVGGYGRGELFPHSDVDVVILLPQPLGDEGAGGVGGIERFIGLMWDTGLEIGHSVRTI